MSEYHTMYHDGYAKAYFIETPEHERLAIFPYGFDKGDLPLIKAKEAASKALDFFNGQISGAHHERYIAVNDDGVFYVTDTQECKFVSSWFTDKAAQEAIERLIDSGNAKQKGGAQ